MGLSRLLLLCAVGPVLASALAWPQTPSQFPPRIPPSIPLVLAGGTVVDVTDWGHSAKDMPDAIVIVRDGRITDVGSRMAVSIPKGARVIDCTGKFLIPGLVDGFAGMNSQGQANANLYHGRHHRGRGQRRLAAAWSILPPRPAPTSTCWIRSARPTTGACWPSAPSGPSSSGRARVRLN